MSTCTIESCPEWSLYHLMSLHRRSTRPGVAEDPMNDESEELHNIEVHYVENAKPSLARTLVKVFVPTFLKATLLKLLQDILIFVVPELLR